MTMYEELVKKLRIGAKIFPGQILYGYGKTPIDLMPDDIDKAADAIEDLQKQLQKSEEDNVNLTGWLAEEHAKHLWIPVTERLPEKSGWYLTFVCNKWKGSLSDQTVSIWDGERFHVGSFAIVTHWMPLPSPPKDGEE